MSNSTDYNLEASKILDADHNANPEVDEDGSLEGACLTCGYAVGWRDDSYGDPEHYTLADADYVKRFPHIWDDKR
jgi:hypothetical protein